MRVTRRYVGGAHDTRASPAVPTPHAKRRLCARCRGDPLGGPERFGQWGRSAHRLRPSPPYWRARVSRAPFDATRRTVPCGSGLRASGAVGPERTGPRWMDGAERVCWPGGGDIDHLVRSPDGLGFAIETKTLTFNQGHLRRTEATARWAGQRRRRYPHGVIPVLRVVRRRRVESLCGDVVVVSLDRLLPLLEACDGHVLPGPIG